MSDNKRYASINDLWPRGVPLTAIDGKDYVAFEDFHEANQERLALRQQVADLTARAERAEAILRGLGFDIDRDKRICELILNDPRLRKAAQQWSAQLESETTT